MGVSTRATIILLIFASCYELTRGQIGCGLLTSACSADSDCCDPLICRSGRCGVCGSFTAACSSDSVCCNPLKCRSGSCKLPAHWTNCTVFAACSNDSDCCTGLICRSGSCNVCDTVTVACSADSDCCSPLECQSGSCNFPAQTGSSGVVSALSMCIYLVAMVTMGTLVF